MFGALGQFALGQIDHPTATIPSVISLNILDIFGEITEGYLDDAIIEFSKGINAIIFVFDANSLNLSPIAILEGGTALVYNIHTEIDKIMGVSLEIQGTSMGDSGISNVLSRRVGIGNILEN